MNTFVTHPSVRIKGTENNYQPVRCMDSSCSDNVFHMHCPLCVKTDVYQDPVILKAHFRVKHVDKGIDFAGLKVLRCCDHCDIVGIIKGEKKFKGAHWHCYKCRNGFNRRDEAIKHYKTHFRNPQTTFQIQIAQEINQASTAYQETICSGGTALESAGLSIHPALTQAVMSTSLAQGQSLLTGANTQVSLSNKSSDGTVSASVAANETVQSTGHTHHIMIIQEEPLEDGVQGEEAYTTQVISSDDVSIGGKGEEETENHYEELQQQANHQNSNNRYEELQQKYEELLMEKMNNEQSQRNEIQHLKGEISVLQNEVERLQKREESLLQQLSVPSCQNIERLLAQLETQHRDLLQQQLLEIKKFYKVKSLTELNTVNIDTDTSSITDNRKCITVHSNSDVSANEILTVIQGATANEKHLAVGHAFPLPEGKSASEGITISTSQDGAVLDGKKEPYVVCIEYSDMPGPKADELQVNSPSLELECSIEDSEVMNEPSQKKLKTS